MPPRLKAQGARLKVEKSDYQIPGLEPCATYEIRNLVLIGKLLLNFKFCSDLEHLRGRKIEDIIDSGFKGNLFQIFFDFFHGRGDKGKPNIIGVITLVVMGDTRITVDDFSESVDFIGRDPGGAQRTDKTQFSGNEISTNPPNNAFGF